MAWSTSQISIDSAGLQPQPAAATHGLARIIDRPGNILCRVLDDVLHTSRMPPDAVNLRRRRVSVYSIVEQCMQTVAPLVAKRGQRLALSLSSESMELDADSARLCQALQNLMLNAMRYSDSGAVIHMRVERDEGEALVIVRDSGVGIAAEQLEAIFASGTRLGGENATPWQHGLGISLHLARRFVEAHGGTVIATSEGVGRGSTFRLRVPCLGFYSEASATPQKLPIDRSVSCFTTA